MTHKYLKATLKSPIEARVLLSGVSYVSNPLDAHRIVETEKRNLVKEIQETLHQKIATLHIDDIVFEFIEE